MIIHEGTCRLSRQINKLVLFFTRVNPSLFLHAYYKWLITTYQVTNCTRSKAVKCTCHWYHHTCGWSMPFTFWLFLECIRNSDWSVTQVLPIHSFHGCIRCLKTCKVDECKTFRVACLRITHNLKRKHHYVVFLQNSVYKHSPSKLVWRCTWRGCKGHVHVLYLFILPAKSLWATDITAGKESRSLAVYLMGFVLQTDNTCNYSCAQVHMCTVELQQVVGGGILKWILHVLLQADFTT